MAHPTVEDDFPRVVNDNCCMSGLGTIRLRSQIPESQVLYVSYENEVLRIGIFPWVFPSCSKNN